MNSEAAQSLPPLSGTLCSNALPLLSQSHHASASPLRLPPWQMEDGIWTQVDADLHIHSRPSQSCLSPALHPASERHLRNSKCFFFLLPGTHPLPFLRSPVSSWSKPCFRTFLEASERPAPRFYRPCLASPPTHILCCWDHNIHTIQLNSGSHTVKCLTIISQVLVLPSLREAPGNVLLLDNSTWLWDSLTAAAR